MEEETAYICKSVGSTTGTSEWIKIKGSGGSGSVYMGDIRPELDPEQEFDEDTENRAIWIDTHDDFTQDNYYGPDAAPIIVNLPKVSNYVITLHDSSKHQFMVGHIQQPDGL